MITRAQWPIEQRTAAGLLSALEETSLPDPVVLERLEAAQELDRSPEDPWRSD